MRTETIQLFQFSELSEEAKQVAIEKHREQTIQSGDFHWQNENRQSWEEFMKVFPVEISNRGQCISFTGSDEVAALSGLRLHKYLLNNYFNDLFKGKYYGSVEVKHIVKHKRVRNPKAFNNGNFFNPYYSAITFDNCCVLTGYCMDESILEPVYNFFKNPDNTTFEQLMDECFSAYEKAWEADQEWQLSDEYISETIEANNYEFDEDGNEY